VDTFIKVSKRLKTKRMIRFDQLNWVLIETLDDDKLSFNGDSSYVHWRVGYGYMATEDVTLTVAYDGTNGKDDFGGAGDDRLSASVSWAF
jgi:hypothetical protein